MRAKVEANRRFLERDGGDFTGKPADPILTEPVIASEAVRTVAPKGETLIELHERYLAERHGISEEWKTTNRAIMRLFVKTHVGERTAARQITKKHVRAFKDGLLKFPSRGTLRDPDATFKIIISRNEREKRPAISARTVNKYLSAVSSFADWLVENDIADENPVSGVYIRDEGAADKRDPFTVAQLETMFGSPLYTGAMSNDPRYVHLPGEVQFEIIIIGCRLLRAGPVRGLPKYFSSGLTTFRNSQGSSA